jgi:hypothetical protein
VQHRLAIAYRPSTRSSQQLAVRTLATFCIFYNLQFPNVGVATILAFVEFLADNKLAKATIKNYIGFIKAEYKSLDFNIVNFQSHLIKLAIKSLEKNSTVKYRPKPILDVQQILQLLQAMPSWAC